MSLVDNDSPKQRVMGFEPTTFTLATCKSSAVSTCNDKDLRQEPVAHAAPGAARSAEKHVEPSLPTVPADPDLAAVADAWSELPEPVRAGIVAMVRAIESDGG